MALVFEFNAREAIHITRYLETLQEKEHQNDGEDVMNSAAENFKLLLLVIYYKFNQKSIYNKCKNE